MACCLLSFLRVPAGPTNGTGGVYVADGGGLGLEQGREKLWVSVGSVGTEGKRTQGLNWISHPSPSSFQGRERGLAV